MKFIEPGASTKSTWLPSQVKKPREALRLVLRSFSSASQSMALVPSSTEPALGSAPDR